MASKGGVSLCSCRMDLPFGGLPIEAVAMNRKIPVSFFPNKLLLRQICFAYRTRVFLIRGFNSEVQF